MTYTCDVGYTLQGSNSRTCQSNGQWTGSLPQCQRTLKVCNLFLYRNSFEGKLTSSLSFIFSSYSLLQLPAAAPAKTEGHAQLLTHAPVMWGGLECSVKQVNTVQRLALADVLGSVALLYHSPVQSIVLDPPQPSTVVILVLPQMVNALSPVQPTTL